MEHTHTSTTVTVCHIVDNIAVAHSESVPLHILIFLVNAWLIASGIISPPVIAILEAAVFVGTIRSSIFIPRHMPCGDAYIRLVEHVMALAHASSVRCSVIGTFIHYASSKR